ncbi:uncharacterized protein LOC128392121 [Panonychus citri]|uniref:uncharacterized protein LOC128392121 n=1 Tax=Panonychus citri TaxID=50023 RepID=UPI0023073570|nr:uncharacterized protein LOC128392121 [Panonychus citri]
MLIVFVITTLIVSVVQPREMSTCTDDCLSKTYCLSVDGKNDCSGKVKVRAKFSVIQQPGSYDRLRLLLLGYGIDSTSELSISLTLKALKAPTIGQTTYSCYKSSLGATKSDVFQKDSNSTTICGSSYYSDGTLSCIWIFSMYDSTWPMLKGEPAKLIDDKLYQISLGYDKVASIVAQDSSDLPIYQLQFLYCCNKVHGKDKYLFTFAEAENGINFLVHIFDSNPLATTISLKNRYGNQLLFSCLFATVTLNAKLIDEKNETKINDQIVSQYIADSSCSWSTLLHLYSSSVILKLPTDVYNLQIIFGNVVVYEENEVTLKNSCSSLSIKNFYITFIVLMFGQKLYFGLNGFDR